MYSAQIKYAISQSSSSHCSFVLDCPVWVNSSAGLHFSASWVRVRAIYLTNRCKQVSGQVQTSTLSILGMLGMQVQLSPSSHTIFLPTVFCYTTLHIKECYPSNMSCPCLLMVCLTFLNLSCQQTTNT